VHVGGKVYELSQVAWGGREALVVSGIGIEVGADVTMGLWTGRKPDISEIACLVW
jgi:hypothetical protein